jgi:hypothetical protein
VYLYVIAFFCWFFCFDLMSFSVLAHFSSIPS